MKNVFPEQLTHVSSAGPLDGGPRSIISPINDLPFCVCFCYVVYFIS